MQSSANLPSPETAHTVRRIIAPDIARGLALFGIAWANLAQAWAVVPAEVPGASFGGVGPFGVLDEIAVVISAMFAHVRGLPMFSTLLGFGIGLITLSLLRRGFPRREAKKTLARRYGWLAAFGAVHSLFLFFGDIMINYGLIAMSVILLIGRKDRTLLLIAGIMWLLMAVGSVFGALFIPPAYLGQSLSQHLPEFSNYLIYLNFNLIWLVIKTLTTPFIALAMMPVMLVGFVAARQGVHRNVERFRGILWAAVIVTVLACVGIGLPLGLASLGILPEEWAPRLAMINQAFGPPTGPGIAAAILLACQPLERRIQAGGTPPVPLRMTMALRARSMSGYLLQSVFFVVICMPFGFGIGPEIGAFGQFLLALGVWAVTVLLAWALQLVDRPGAFEAVHRRLSYGKDGLPERWEPI